MDKGRIATDKELNKIKRQVSVVYSEAEKKATAKLEKYLDKYRAEDEDMRQQVEDGEINESEYEDWRIQNIMTGKDWKKTKSDVAEEYTKANIKAMDIVNKAVPIIYAINYNFMGGKLTNEVSRSKDREYDVKIPKITPDEFIKRGGKIYSGQSAYSLRKNVNIPKDKRWNERKMNSEVLKGIKNGESMDKIAKRLQKVTDMTDAAAIRNARTMVTAAENGARQATADYLYEEYGIDTMKIWDAVGDERTRDSHNFVSGETVPRELPFSNGLMYAGDPAGPPDETFNCRCSTDYVPYKESKLNFRGK